MRIAFGLSIVAIAVIGAMVRADDEDERKISVSDCPPAVQKTLKNESKNGKIIDVDVRTVDGEKIYESEVWFGNREYDLVIRGDGLLLSKTYEGQAKGDDDDGDDDDEADDEDDGDDDDEADDDDGDDEDDEGDDDDDDAELRVRMQDLPKAVRKTLKKSARGGEIDEIIMEREGKRIVYEAVVEFGEKEYEFKIAWDGTFLSKELEDDDDDDGDDDRDDD